MSKTVMSVLRVAFLVCVCSSSGWTYGKTTIDPNTLKKPEVSETTVDTRLASKIDYEARGKSVASILKDLTAMTDVKLYSGFNNNDWQVRDRKMNVFAKDATLASIMNSIARVMSFQWIRYRARSKGLPLLWDAPR